MSVSDEAARSLLDEEITAGGKDLATDVGAAGGDAGVSAEVKERSDTPGSAAIPNIFDVIGDAARSRLTPEQLKNLEIYAKVEQEIPVTRVRCCSDPETNAKLVLYNPVAVPIASAAATYTFFRQILRLWPNLYASFLKYFTIPSAFLGGVGFEVARRGLDPLSNPVPQAALFTGLEATVGSFRYSLGLTIETFCQYNSDETTILFNRSISSNSTGPNCSLLDGTFIGAMVVPNFVLFLLGYVAYYSIPVERRFQFTLQSKTKSFLVHGLDILLKSLFFGGLLQAFAMTVSPIPESLAYQWAWAPALAAKLMIKKYPKYEQKINTGILYTMFGTLSYILGDIIKQELTRPQNSDEPNSDAEPWAIFKLVLFGGIAVVGTGLTLWKSLRYVRETQKMARYVQLRQDNLVVFEKDALNKVVDRARAQVSSDVEKVVQEQTELKVAAARASLEKEFRSISGILQDLEPDNAASVEVGLRRRSSLQSDPGLNTAAADLGSVPASPQQQRSLASSPHSSYARSPSQSGSRAISPLSPRVIAGRIRRASSTGPLVVVSLEDNSAANTSANATAVVATNSDNLPDSASSATRTASPGRGAAMHFAFDPNAAPANIGSGAGLGGVTPRTGAAGRDADANDAALLRSNKSRPGQSNTSGRGCAVM